MATSLSAREQIAAQILCGLIHKLEEPYSGTIYVTEPSDSEQHDHDPPSATSLMPTIRVWPQSAYLAELAIEYADALLKAMEREA
jgi:hypothetical protein